MAIERLFSFTTGALALTATLMLAGCDAPAPPPAAPSSTIEAADPVVRSAIEQAHQAAVDAEESAEARIAYALVLQANGLAADASTAWAQVSQMAPSDPRPTYYTAMAASERGDVQAAVDAMTQSITLDPTHAPAHWRHGQWLLDLGRSDDAMSAFTEALKHDPSAAAARLGQARVQMERGEHQQAATALQSLLQATGHPHVRYLLGQALQRSGQADAAAPFLRDGDPQAPRFPDDRATALLDAKHGLDAEYDRIDRAIADNDLLKAQRTAQSALKVWPDDIGLLARLGDVHRRRNDSLAWLRVARQAVRVARDDYMTQLNLSMALRANDQLGPALTAAMAAADAQPDVPDGHLQVARIHLVAKRPDDAVAAMDTAFALGVTDPLERLQYAAVLIEVERYDDAITQSHMVAQSHPATPRAWLILGEAHRRKGELQLAFEAAMAGLQHSPQHPQLSGLARAVRNAALSEESGQQP